MIMPLRHQHTKNHKRFTLYKLHFVELSVLSVFVAKNDFSEWVHLKVCKILSGSQDGHANSPDDPGYQDASG